MRALEVKAGQAMLEETVREALEEVKEEVVVVARDPLKPQSLGFQETIIRSMQRHLRLPLSAMTRSQEATMLTLRRNARFSTSALTRDAPATPSTRSSARTGRSSTRR